MHSQLGEAGTDTDAVIRDETTRADAHGYALEWKLYGHDEPADLADRLLAAGFRPDAAETVLALPLTDASASAFTAPAYDIRRVHDADGLDAVVEISREIGRTGAEEEKHRLAAVLRETPREMSVHVAYVDGEPVACGRTHFAPGSGLSELAGGRTKTTHRRRGLFTALVAARLHEALARGRTHLVVDALPTSEPILRKRGFHALTRTRPYLYEPAR
ncbi:GNAT family N-acetyltransferase [Saccharopolyspora erythraea]|uniref:GNAT family N-acetyltransferase n=1 Tax=Saccharopolyspora erythraea TaxID=1836 RepID=UPI001BAC0261|nr:GNAT family N-acetyltransferase [Saccharopolyspora erythraea]QUH00026.1 GNAT family N-acetyltransferase [Saccharopolyspora erythraea]